MPDQVLRRSGFAAGEAVAVLLAWAVVQWLAWQALGHVAVGHALGGGHHPVSAVAGGVGGVLVILAAARLSRARSRPQSALFAGAAFLASLLVGAGHMSGGLLPQAAPVVALLVVVAVVQAATAALACLVWREAARAWCPRVVVAGCSSVEVSQGPVVGDAPVLIALRQGAPCSSRAPPVLSQL